MTLHKPRPFLQDTAALAGSVTILGAPRKVLTKRYSVGPMGQVIQSAYDRAKRFVRQTPGGAELTDPLIFAALYPAPCGWVGYKIRECGA
jgi:hypothetical protein